MKILINGLHGHMGFEVAKLAIAGYRGITAVEGVDAMPNRERETSDIPCAPDFASANPNVDCIVDFSHHSMTVPLLGFAKKHRLPLVLATTGQTEEEKAEIFSAAKEIPLFFASNYSLGIALLTEAAKKIAAAMPDAEIEIIEKHHDRKLDAPSGTALSLAEAIREVRPGATVVKGRSGNAKRSPEEIGIHAVRMGNLVGEHEVMIGTPNQIITLKHEAFNRALFAEGALAAAAFLCGKPAGLYDMKSLLEN